MCLWEEALAISSAYHDTDILELRVSAWNGFFGGTTELYIGRDDLEKIVEEMKGFPLDPQDEREVILGAFGAKSDGGAARTGFTARTVQGTEWSRPR